ncbi:uncharacterized protein LOC116200511 [Punica granatum]|uniref:Uncharacterized protein LOC116200511 n=1 Tax=Punica granatum TaxID=22663 RepID=A0A6P8D7B1_PUNGR|nr:uncharacterized protein LOC116200511 [Punica granatum]
MDTHNVDTGFKFGYLSELEKMLLEKLPNCCMKARPHIESRLKTLKTEWAIMYDMMLNTSGFGWDSTRKMVTTEDDVWEAYVTDAQAVEDILKELEVENLTGAAEEVDVNPSNQNESANANTSTLRDVDRAHLLPTEDPGSASLGRKGKKNEGDFSTISQAVNTMAADMKDACLMLLNIVHSDIVQEKFLELSRALHGVDGLTSVECAWLFESSETI